MRTMIQKCYCLLPFLRSSQHYTLEKAYKICLKRDLMREQVFILGRMGNVKKDLAVIINKLGDIEEAVEFVTIQHDDVASARDYVLSLFGNDVGENSPSQFPISTTHNSMIDFQVTLYSTPSVRKCLLGLKNASPIVEKLSTPTPIQQVAAQST
jgi:hypothetical protein